MPAAVWGVKKRGQGAGGGGGRETLGVWQSDGGE